MSVGGVADGADAPGATNNGGLAGGVTPLCTGRAMTSGGTAAGDRCALVGVGVAPDHDGDGPAGASRPADWSRASAYWPGRRQRPNAASPSGVRARA